MAFLIYCCILLGWKLIIYSSISNINIFEVSNSVMLVYSINTKLNTSIFKVNSKKYSDLSNIKNNKTYPLCINKTEYINQMIIGLILGDGTLVKKYEKGNAYLKYTQSLSHIDYIQHIFNLLVSANYCNITKLEVKDILVKGKIYKYLDFNTKSLQEFTILHSLFYYQKKKIIPITIENLLTPIGLAYWVMDDGSKLNTGFHFNTNGFERIHVEILTKVLFNKFNLKCSIHSRNRIFIWKNSVPQLISLIEPYIVPSMLYKIKPNT